MTTKRPTGLVCGMVVVACVALPAVVRAADVVVTKTADTNDGVCDGDCSLREAIDNANPGDTVRIPAGVYTVDPQLSILKGLTLQGSGAFVTIVQAAASPGIAGHRVFGIDTSSSVAFIDMTIRHGALFGDGSNGGAIGGEPGSGPLDIIRCQVVHNEVHADGGTNGGNATGGAIFWSGSDTVTIRESNIADNRATANGTVAGGAVTGGAGMTGSLVIINSSVVRNTISVAGRSARDLDGAGAGGAFFCGALTLTNSTVSNNGISPAGAASGGAFFTAGAIVFSSTIAENFLQAEAASGGSFFGRVTMRNSILAGNTPPCFDLTSAGYNLIADDDSDSPCGYTLTTGDQSGNIDPRLGPLALNGATTLTRALLEDSPAIDAANPAGCVDQNAAILTTDQRGFGRPFDANNDNLAICDIGAFEFRGLQTSAPAAGWLGLLALAATLAGLGIRRLT